MTIHDEAEKLADALGAWLATIRNGRTIEPSIMGLSDMVKVASTLSARLKAAEALDLTPVREALQLNRRIK